MTRERRYIEVIRDASSDSRRVWFFKLINDELILDHYAYQLLIKGTQFYLGIAAWSRLYELPYGTLPMEHGEPFNALPKEAVKTPHDVKMEAECRRPGITMFDTLEEKDCWGAVPELAVLIGWREAQEKE